MRAVGGDGLNSSDHADRARRSTRCRKDQHRPRVLKDGVRSSCAHRLHRGGYPRVRGGRRVLDDAGYRAAYAVAEDNLRLGHTVVADSVNPLPITRLAWVEVARKADVPVIEVEIVCSDKGEHRRRVEDRLRGGRQTGPTWGDVVARDYRPWPSVARVIDTATLTVDQAVANLRAALDKP